MARFDILPFAQKITDFNGPIRFAVYAVAEVGVIFYMGTRGREGLYYEASMKPGDARGEGEQMVTLADRISQWELVSTLSHRCPGAKFISEEAPDGHENLLVQDADVGTLGEIDLVFGIDPVDGTLQFKHKMWEWSISVGIMERGVHTGGVIFAPDVRGGLLIAGEKGKGVVLAEDGGSRVERVGVADRPKNQSVIFSGVGLGYLSGYNKFVNSMTREVLVNKSVGSCALGLAAVAAGRADALVQPAQRPHDWFAGVPLVEAAGGKAQFYHYRDGAIVALDKPDFASYRNALETAFIAGSPDTVDWLFDLLLRTWGR